MPIQSTLRKSVTGCGTDSRRWISTWLKNSLEHVPMQSIQEKVKKIELVRFFDSWELAVKVVNIKIWSPVCECRKTTYLSGVFALSS